MNDVELTLVVVLIVFIFLMLCMNGQMKVPTWEEQRIALLIDLADSLNREDALIADNKNVREAACELQSYMGKLCDNNLLSMECHDDLTANGLMDRMNRLNDALHKGE